MDKRLIAERFAKAAETYGREATVQMQIADHMATLLQRHAHGHRHDNILEIGCGTGSYSRMLIERFSPKRLVLNDLCREMLQQCHNLHADMADAGSQSVKMPGVEMLHGDAESIDLPAQQDMITSCSTIQWFDNPGKFFNRCSDSLTADGILAFSSFGRENMKEVTQLTGDGLPYRSMEELKQELSSRYDVVCAEEQIIEKHFACPKDVLRHLKQTGVTGIRSRRWTPRQLLEFCDKYTDMFGSGTDVTLTYHPIYIIAKKKRV